MGAMEACKQNGQLDRHNVDFSKLGLTISAMDATKAEYQTAQPM